ncbi:MAG: YceI family protein, partial [Opitutaceae bacterium]|nr:YceI family protein [Opitutaceae bacterium]
MNLTNSRILRQFTAALVASGASLVAFAAPQTFDFTDPKGVNNVQFSLDAPLESITGTSTGISGKIVYDPAAPETVSGVIVLDASTLTVGNAIMRDHMLGENWLDAAKHPTIRFEAGRVAAVRRQAAKTEVDLVGTLTLKGVSKEITVPVSFTHLPDKLGARLGDEKVRGDLLVVRTQFTVQR